jgi:cell fate regulator YaaT (PSP1 superfamily)
LQDDTSPENKARPEEEKTRDMVADKQQGSPLNNFYYIRFRNGAPSFSAASRLAKLTRGEVVMTQTDHGLEPATLTTTGPELDPDGNESKQRASYLVVRQANRDEIAKFERLMEREKEAFSICTRHIEKHKLAMKLIRVERFFNGSKIIFYFTAENRVDFRELVKDLVQEFRTRVEIRQIGVRHETKMIGGLGCCGRELCCSSFIKNFAPVSIKMAKEQSLPLNPAKISGVCNRLLCCLTYEYPTYHKLRKGMPKPGKTVNLDGISYKVVNSNILQEKITLMQLGEPDKRQVLTKEEWLAMKPAVDHDREKKKPKSDSGKGRRGRSKKADRQQDKEKSAGRKEHPQKGSQEEQE